MLKRDVKRKMREKWLKRENGSESRGSHDEEQGTKEPENRMAGCMFRSHQVESAERIWDHMKYFRCSESNSLHTL